MQRIFLRVIAGITLVASFALFQQQIQAQAPVGEPASKQTTIYLPFVRTPGESQPQPQPQPQPVSAGFFALTDYLTYNAATAIDAQGVVHLAFYASDERHGDAPLASPTSILRVRLERLPVAIPISGTACSRSTARLTRCRSP